MKIVFMGTPEIAVGTLSALYNEGHEIAAVFTQPDKPVGRKQILTPPPVKQFAESKGIEVFQPVTLRDGTALDLLKEINPDIIVVVAYGKILPKEILELPKYGCVNGHASLLPKYRGASPIQWCIVCGEAVTGVTVMQMDEGMDTGDIIDKAEVGISDAMTADELYDILTDTAADLIINTIKKIENGTAVYTKQNDSEATYAPIIKKEMAKIDFNKEAREIHNAVRGFYSWPTAYFYLFGKRVKVYKTRVTDKTSASPSTVIESDKKLIIACGNNTAIELLEIQNEGSKRMPASSFLAGNKIPVGFKIED